MVPTEPQVADSPQAQLRRIIETFARSTPGVRGVAIADRNGLPVASSFRTRLDLATASAMSTLAVQAAENVFTNFGYAKFHCVTMEGGDALIVACKVRGGLVNLIAVLAPDANLGFARIAIDRTTDEIAEVLERFL